MVVRLAARLYGTTPELQAEKREEWLRTVQDMRPSERPAHAGSLLWIAVASAPIRAKSRFLYLKGLSGGIARAVEISAQVCGEPIGRFSKGLCQMKVFLAYGINERRGDDLSRRLIFKYLFADEKHK